jgi:ADP-ribose pyrophosphatase YjhB (NUDIX family)
MPSIRPIALVVPRRGDDLLVVEYHDETRNETFHRPLGGGIEFGETAEAAVRREMREEIGAELADVRLLGVLENIFHGFGRDGHEIAFIFDCRLADGSLYERDLLGEILDDPGIPVLWRPPHAGEPLYPAGLAAMLERH